MMNIGDDEKKQIEKLCSDFLKKYAIDNDSKLSGGSFASQDNYCRWTDDDFVINLLSISQDDFCENFELFEQLGKGLRNEIELVAKVNEVSYADDCPMIYFQIVK